MKRFENAFIRLLPLMLLFALFASTASADVYPTNEWINLYSTNSLLNGNPLPEGALIDAYDPLDVHCGADTVAVAGEYGFLAVYRDDTMTTPGFDEGADPGDEISLRINGVPATVTSGGPVIWTTYGEGFEVDLSVNYLLGVRINAPPNGMGTPGMYTYYDFWVVNTGEGTDFFHLSLESEHVWSPELMVSGTTDYVPAGDSVEVTARVFVPGGAQDGDTDLLTLTAESAMDGSVYSDGVVTTIVSSAAANEIEGLIPGVFQLYQNYPNPFNPATKIEFALERAGDVKLEVFNVLGQRINTLMDGYLASGSYETEWDGTMDSGAKVSTGIYFYRLSTGQYSLTRKMILMK